MRIGLVGDRNDKVASHAAIPRVLEECGRLLGRRFEPVWLPTDSYRPVQLDEVNGIWCVPASPYASMEGALAAIRYARERKRPFLGTCGGFQHAVIEFARNVLGQSDADHAETNPTSGNAVIYALSCSLVGKTGTIRFTPGSIAARLYESLTTTERYHCNYGVNPQRSAWLSTSALHATGFDEEDSIRVVELQGHPFFVGSLFQPELTSSAERPAPLVRGFLAAAAASTLDSAK